MRFPCLVLDHDDTVVRSEETVNYPAFLQALALLRPGQSITRDEFSLYCCHKGYTSLCRDRFLYTQKEEAQVFALWQAYVRTHVPPPYPGIRTLLQRYRAEGGLICVASHSADENINRDYQTHFGLKPDRIYGWELGEEKRKPKPFPLLDIMQRYNLAPGQLLMLDDMRPGLTMAQSCGVSFACAGWSHENAVIAAEMKAACEHYFVTVEEFSAFLFFEH